MAGKYVSHVLDAQRPLYDRNRQITKRGNNSNHATDDQAVREIERLGKGECRADTHCHDNTTDIALDRLLR